MNPPVTDSIFIFFFFVDMLIRLKSLLRVFLWTLLGFIVFKLLFVFYCNNSNDLSVRDYFDVVVHGFTLDLAVASYLIVIPVLISMVSLWWQGRGPLFIGRSYFFLISAVISLGLIADLSLYQFWRFKLDTSFLQYLESPSEVVANVSVGYIISRIIILTVTLFIIACGFNKLCLIKEAYSSKQRLLGKLMGTVLHFMLIPLCFLGIRGGTYVATTNIGQAYYSSNQFLNHSAVNPLFSFFYSAVHAQVDADQYQFMSEEQSLKLTENVYTTKSIDTQSLLGNSRPNIAIIMLEGCGEEFAGVMPYFQSLKQEGIYFSNCYGNTWRTDRGAVCTYNGYPSFPAMSVMKMPKKSINLPGIARSLGKEGYHNTFLYGGDVNFTNMRGFLFATGWEKIISKEDYPSEQKYSSHWGVLDEITFKTLYEQINEKAKENTPYLFGFTTLSTHEPWDVPIHAVDDEVLNTFVYLDNCIRDFIETLKKSPAWDNLLLVFIADHGVNYKDIDNSKPLQRNHIPLLFVGGAVKEPKVVDLICNQSDLAATLLGQLGISHDDYLFSRDVLSKSYTYPTAVNNYNNVQLLLDSDGHILYDFDAKRFIINNSPDAEKLLKINEAILQRTTNDLTRR